MRGESKFAEVWRFIYLFLSNILALISAKRTAKESNSHGSLSLNYVTSKKIFQHIKVLITFDGQDCSGYDSTS